MRSTLEQAAAIFGRQTGSSSIGVALRAIESIRAGAGKRLLISGIGMPHHAARRVIPQHSLQALRSGIAAVADDDHPRMLRVPHADPAAVVERNPRRAARAVEERVEQCPVRYRIGAVAHRLGLAVGARHRSGVEVISPDDDRRFELSRAHHLVEREPGAMPLAEPQPADARRQALEMNLS
jgi:hypothetical protein